MHTQITISQAVEGFNLARRAEQLSKHTLSDYNTTFRRLLRWFDPLDPFLDEITVDDLRQFFDGMSRKTVTLNHGVAPRPARRLSPKTILNIHTGLSALWAWAQREGYVCDNVVREIQVEKPAPPAIEALSREDVELLLQACEWTRSYKRPGKRETKHSRRTCERDRLIIRFLLDTGVRVSELCDLTIGQVDLRNQRARVMGKGRRERFVPLGRKLCKYIWRYLATRPDAEPDDPFIADQNGEYGLSRYAVGRLLKRLGKKAGVSNVYPHRFRHTMAIEFLRNDGQEIALMRILGHSTMEMTRRYAQIAQSDVQRNHKNASPLDNWNV